MDESGEETGGHNTRPADNLVYLEKKLIACTN